MPSLRKDHQSRLTIKIRSGKLGKCPVIRRSAYQVVPACGRQGYQNIRVLGVKNLLMFLVNTGLKLPLYQRSDVSPFLIYVIRIIAMVKK